MWPWDHLVVGYLGYSALVRFRGAGSPTTRATVAVLVGSQFPDLVDKPLAWTFGVLPSGTSLAHSLLFALPVSALAIALARTYGVGDVGLAFAVGYLLHLPADALYGLFVGGHASFGFFFWPLVPASDRPPVGFVTRFVQLFTGFLRILSSPAGWRYLVLEAALLVAAVGVWIRDGSPGAELVTAALHAVRARS